MTPDPTMLTLLLICPLYVSKEYIEANYAEKVTFISVNREEDQNKELVEKYKIAGQTLIIVFDQEVVNLTTDAFMNARSNPEKLENVPWGKYIRFIKNPSDEIFKRIHLAENQSYEICETCGEKGEMRTDLGWYSTLCNKHYEERKSNIQR